MEASELRQDRRTLRTRAAIVEAYNELVVQQRQEDITVAIVTARANVGRSTFYQHYAGLDALFAEAVARPLAVLAETAVGSSGPNSLEGLLRHFWENRRRAREMLAGRSGARISRLLASLVEERLVGDFIIPHRLVSVLLAETAFAPVRAWLGGEAACTPHVLAQAVSVATASARDSIRIDRGTADRSRSGTSQMSASSG